MKTKEVLSTERSAFLTLMHALVALLYELNAGVMFLRDVMGITRPTKFSDFCLYLELMEVFGSGYFDDVDYTNYNLRQSETHTESMIKQLE